MYELNYMGDHMKNIEEILKYKKISDIAFYLDYYDMIEEMFKHKTSRPPTSFEARKRLEERFKDLCSKSENKKNSICIVKLNKTKRL